MRAAYASRLTPSCCWKNPGLPTYTAAPFTRAVAPAPVIDRNSVTSAGLADTKAYIAAMKAAGMGSATQIDEGGEGWDTGRELADAITAAKSIAPNDVKNALQKQKLTVGGIIMYSWTRTSSDHSSMTGSGDSAMVTVGADGTFDVLPHVGG